MAGRAPPGGGRPGPAPRRGPLVRGPVRAPRWTAPGDTVAVLRLGRRPGRASRRRRSRWWPRPGGATGGWWRPPRPADAGRRRRSRWPPTRSWCAPAAGPDVVAGYPWFGAWSRDTMISYEGLFLATGRADEGRELLRGVRRDAVRGDAGQHRRHRPGASTTRSTGRCGSCTRWAGTWPPPATPTWPPSCCPRCAAWSTAHLAGTRYGIAGRPGRRAAHPGRRRARR